MNARRATVTLSLLAALHLHVTAQDLSQFKVNKGIRLSGSLGLNTVSHHGKSLNWFAAGTLNLDIFGYSAPFSFTRSNANTSFSQPFNRFSISPQFKWVRLYLGYHALTFSSYTLAGHTILGAGIEVTPGKWKIVAIHGQLRKAVQFTLIDSLQHIQASFRRMGSALKVSYEDSGGLLAVNIFAGQDDATSLNLTPVTSQLAPQQNVAIGLGFRKKILNRIFVDGEYATSALTADTRAMTTSQDVPAMPGIGLVSKLMPVNATSRYFDAVNAGAGYNGNKYSIRVRFEQIAPGYRTLGSYMFNSDMRSITIAPMVRVARNRIVLNLNAGFQQNNLDHSQLATSSRMVGAVNATVILAERWNAVLHYSNFTSYTTSRPRPDPLRLQSDSLTIYQVNRSASCSFSRAATTGKSSVMLNVAYQQAMDNTMREGGKSADVVTINASYSTTSPGAGLTWAVSGNYYTTASGGVETASWGPSLNVSKTWLDKTLRCSWIGSYNQVSGTAPSRPVLTNRVSMSYTPPPGDGKAHRPHQFTAGFNLLKKLQGHSEQAMASVTMSYQYQF